MYRRMLLLMMVCICILHNVTPTYGQLFGKQRLNINNFFDGRFVSTEFKHATGNAPFLDGFNPPDNATKPIEVLPRGKGGGFLIHPGCYSGKFHTY